MLSLLPVLAVVGGTQFASAAADQLPVTVTNASGRDDSTYVYVIARDGRTGRPGYVDAAGTWHPYDFPASLQPGRPNPEAPDISITGPVNGASRRLTLPPDLSGGRIYLSMGAKLRFFLTTQGLVEPAPWVPGDANRDVLYDWTEFARTGSRIFINTTTVDMFSVPLSVTVHSAGGGSRTEGTLNGDGRTGVFDAFGALGGDWSKLVYRRPSDGLPLRVLAPAHAVEAGLFSRTYLDRYINDVWAYYSTHTLTVTMDMGTFRGTVSGAGLTFRDGAGAVIGTLAKPTTSEVFGCGGSIQPQNQPNQTAILAVGARVCAGLHRGTLSTADRVMSDTQPTTDPRAFYGRTDSDLFSKVMHDHAVSGRAYGFAYDDVADFASTIDEAEPASMTMTIGPFAATAGGTSPGTAPATGPAPTGSVPVGLAPTGSAPTGPAPTSSVPSGSMTGRQVIGPGGMCLDVAGSDTGGDGAAVQLGSCRPEARDQHWAWEGTSLRTLGRCLDVAGGATGNGSKLQLHDCTGHPAQQWVRHGNGLRNPISGRCLDAPGGSTADGTRLQIYDCNGTPAQSYAA